jgi:hypothetical protein
MRVRIEGTDLPGQHDAGLRPRGVHVGVQRKTEVIERVPADAAEAVWEFDVAVREIDGLLDVGGPFVHGRPGARFLYLSWGAVIGEEFRMFRRAKLMFGDIPTATLRAAYEGGTTLVGRLGLTDDRGEPVAARVRPPGIVWTPA